MTELSDAEKELWEKAQEQELHRLIIEREVCAPMAWENLPAGIEPTYCNPVLEHRPGKDRRIRYVFGGNMQQPNELWSSRTTDMPTKKLFLNHTVSHKLNLMTFDIKDFYIAGMNVLDEVEYMFIPIRHLSEAFCKKHVEAIRGGKMLFEVNKGLYGMRQAGYIAQRNLIQILKENGYQEEGKHSIFRDDEKKIVFIVHVDDVAVAYKDKQDVDKLVEVLEKAGYTIKANWEGDAFCGFTIKYNKEEEWIEIGAESVVNKALERFGITEEGRKIDVPYDINDTAKAWKFDAYELPIDQSGALNAKETKILQEKIGALRYIAMATYPHLEVAVGKIAANMATPTRKMMKAADRILQYLAQNKERRIRFIKSEMQVQAYSDASYGTEKNFRSRTGGYVFLGNSRETENPNGPIEVISTVQKNNVCSAMEAEYVAMFEVTLRVVYLRQIAEALGNIQKTTRIEADNRAAVGLANGINTNRKLRHVAMRFHWVREQIAEKVVDVIWRKGSTNVADYATKYLRTKEEYYKSREMYTKRGE